MDFTSNTLEGLVAHFNQIQDFRVDRTKKHELIDIFVIAVCASLAGARHGRGSKNLPIQDWIGLEPSSTLTMESPLTILFVEYSCLMNLGLQVPDDSTLSRRLDKCDIHLGKLKFSEPVHVVRDIRDSGKKTWKQNSEWNNSPLLWTFASKRDPNLYAIY